jgi:hypothetical protein
LKEIKEQEKLIKEQRRKEQAARIKQKTVNDEDDQDRVNEEEDGEESEGEENIEWYRREVGEEPDEGTKVFSTSVLRPPPSSVLRPPSSVLRPPSSVLRPPSSVLRPPSSVLRPPSSVLRPPSSVRLPPFPIKPCCRNEGIFEKGQFRGTDNEKRTKKISEKQKEERLKCRRWKLSPYEQEGTPSKEEAPKFWKALGINRAKGFDCK